MQFFVACLLSLVYFCKLFLPIRMSDSEMLFQYWKIACLSMTRAISNSWELQIESIRAMTLSAPSSVISCAMRISTALAMTYSAVAENISRGGIRAVASILSAQFTTLTSSVSSISSLFFVSNAVFIRSSAYLLEWYLYNSASFHICKSLTGIAYAFPVFHRDLPSNSDSNNRQFMPLDKWRDVFHIYIHCQQSKSNRCEVRLRNGECCQRSNSN